MSEGHQFNNAQDARRFLWGGNARVTIVSKKTGVRYTYRVRRVEGEDDKYFVSLLTGSDNETAYTYVGMVKAGEFRLTKASKYKDTSSPVRGFRYLKSKLDVGVLPDDLEAWHEGRCGRCGRALTVPSSIARGIGPECDTLMGA